SGAESSDAPYFVDLVNDELQNRFQDYDFQAKSYRIYTTLDLNLQRAANDAVSIGMQLVDDLLKKQKRHKNVAFPEAQVALIALAHSMNVATIKVAEMVGFNNVVNLARRAGINEDIRATPSLALGSYEATPLEMAGAYTVFANHGVYEGPTFLNSIREQNGSMMYKHR